MRTGLKVWLWILLVLQIIGIVSSVFTLSNKDTIAAVIEATGIDLTTTYIVGLITTVIMIAGIVWLLFMKKKLGFWIICAVSLFSGVYGILTASGTQAMVILSIVSSIVGIVLAPGITYLLMKKDWETFM